MCFVNGVFLVSVLLSEFLYKIKMMKGLIVLDFI